MPDIGLRVNSNLHHLKTLQEVSPQPNNRHVLVGLGPPNQYHTALALFYLTALAMLQDCHLHAVVLDFGDVQFVFFSSRLVGIEIDFTTIAEDKRK